MLPLTPEKALIFRITHIENVPWILRHGLHSRSSPVRDPNFRAIGLLDLIEKRKHRTVDMPPGGTLSDYVPFYFTPSSLMLYKIVTGHGVERVPRDEIVIFVASLRDLRRNGVDFVFTDRHAKLEAAQFSGDLDDLARIDWIALSTRDFRADPDHPEKKERYQAEALIHRHLPVERLQGMICYGRTQAARLAELVVRAGRVTPVVTRPSYYFV